MSKHKAPDRDLAQAARDYLANPPAARMKGGQPRVTLNEHGNIYLSHPKDWYRQQAIRAIGADGLYVEDGVIEARLGETEVRIFGQVEIAEDAHVMEDTTASCDHDGAWVKASIGKDGARVEAWIFVPEPEAAS